VPGNLGYAGGAVSQAGTKALINLLERADIARRNLNVTNSGLFAIDGISHYACH
jgi:hypothetical protein